MSMLLGTFFAEGPAPLKALGTSQQIHLLETCSTFNSYLYEYF